MALSENKLATRTAMSAAFKAAMEAKFKLDPGLSAEDKAFIRANWGKLGDAIAMILGSILDHVKNNAEIGTVTSTVVGADATQNNTGKGLIE